MKQKVKLLLKLLFLFVVAAIRFLVVVMAGTVIDLVDCLYDMLMEAIAEESSSVAEATAVKESSSTDADATAATAG